MKTRDARTQSRRVYLAFDHIHNQYEHLLQQDLSGIAQADGIDAERLSARYDMDIVYPMTIMEYEQMQCDNHQAVTATLEYITRTGKVGQRVRE